MNLEEKLSKIQFEFKANKSRYNSFGKYNFRSAEDILEGLKPFNEKYGVFFTVKEILINANPPIMLTTATISDNESQFTIEATAVVGIDLEQKGMQMPQKFGSASSYGKKYALGNLLLIDDTLDSDATNTGANEVKKPLKEKIVMLVDSPEFIKAKDYIADGGDITLIEVKYTLTDEIKQQLKN